MEINRSSSFTPLSTSLQQVNNQTDAGRQRAQTQAQQQEQNSVNKQRFDADQQSLQQVAQYQQQNANRASEGNIYREYDQPNQQNLSAVARYQSVDNLAQREAITQTFGVDLYA
ncbi:hypothetical protein [Thalassotalea ganghwensis]